MKLGWVLKYGWLIALAAVMPILRQFIVFKLLVGADLSKYLIASVVVTTAVPLAALGWGDFFAGRVAISRKFTLSIDSLAFTNSIVAIVFVSIILLGFLASFSPIVVAGAAAIDLLFVALLQNCLKLLRSFGRLQLFFGWLVVKQFVDILLLVAAGSLLVPTVSMVLLIEALAAGGVFVVFFAASHLWRIISASSLSKAYFRAALPTAFAFLSNSAFGIIAQNLDRIGLPMLVDSGLYSRYVFAFINTALLLSANAFVFHVAYPQLARLTSDLAGLRRYLHRYDRLILFGGAVLVPCHTITFYLFNVYIYHGPNLTMIQIAAAVVIGWLYLFQIRETVLITAMKVRAVLEATFGALLIYAVTLVSIYSLGLLNDVLACLIPLLVSRSCYLGILWMITRRLLVGMELTAKVALVASRDENSSYGKAPQ